MTHLSKLIDHCVWANETWIRFIADNCPSDEDQMRRMSHILLGEQAWFERIAGEEVERRVWELLTVTQLLKIHAEHRGVFAKLLDGDLERRVWYQRFTGEEYQSPIADILFHLVLHGSHHRGQLAADASSKGLKPVNTDFIQYCLVHRL